MLETVLARSRGISILNPARQEMKVIGKGDGAEFGAPLLQVREERVAARPKTHSEQAILEISSTRPANCRPSRCRLHTSGAGP